MTRGWWIGWACGLAAALGWACVLAVVLDPPWWVLFPIGPLLGAVLSVAGGEIAEGRL